ncbi:SCO1860 family LAETG-anchored protein [Streptomyces sp. NPDC002851]
MNSNPFRMPMRRPAAVAAAAVLAGAGAAVPAHATDDAPGQDGRASAAVLRADLDVSLLDKTVDVPLTTTLNEVHAPEMHTQDDKGDGSTKEKTALTVDVDGVDQGRPFSMLHAEVATAKATADQHKGEGYTNLANAKVHLPGLPAVPLVELQKVTSKAVCAAGERPVAESNVLGDVSVLGKKTSLSARGTTKVEVPDVGTVTLALSKTHRTSRTAAASALELKVAVDPLKLNVAEVKGTVTLANATCEAPTAAKEPAPDPSEPGDKPEAPGDGDDSAGGEKPQGGGDDLAETGGSSATPYLAGGAVALVALGGGALYLARRRSAS